MKFITRLSKKDCMRRLNERFDSWFMFGEERYIGRLKSTEQGTEVRYKLFRGSCDPISIIKIFIGISILVWIGIYMNNPWRYSEGNIKITSLLVSLFSTILINVTRYIIAVGSDRGKVGEKDVLWFIENTMKED